VRDYFTHCGIAKAPVPDGNPYSGFPFLRFLAFIYFPVVFVWVIAMAVGDRWALFVPNGFMSPVMIVGSFVAGSSGAE